MSAFLNNLNVSMQVAADGTDLKNRDGAQLWVLEEDFIYSSDVLGGVVIVPAGFVTDFSSVPRLPLVHMVLADMAQRAAVVHDYLYSTAVYTRKQADDVLMEAMTISGIPWAKRQAIYLGVRVGGASHYG